MSMKLIACAAAVVCAQPVFALDYAATRDIELQNYWGIPGNHIVYLAGSNALNEGIPGALSYICAAGSVTRFDGPDPEVTAYSCFVGSYPPDGMATGDRLIVGLSGSGSFYALTALNPLNFTYKFDGIPLKNAWSNQINFFTPPSSDSATYTRRQSDGGFMDVQAHLFNDLVSKLPGFNGIYEEIPMSVGQGYGVAVSRSLYEALQTAQGLSIAGGGTCVAGDYTAACQPSITKGQYA